VRALRDRSGAYISVVNETVAGGSKKFIVKGSRSAVERAETMIKDVVDGTFYVGHDFASSDPAAAHEGVRPPFKRVKLPLPPRAAADDHMNVVVAGGGGRVRSRASVDTDMSADLNTKCVYVPTSFVGILLADNAEIVLDVEHRTGALIKISQDVESTNRSERLITIHGSAIVCERAHTMLNDLVTEVRERAHVARSKDAIAVNYPALPSPQIDSPTPSRMPILSETPAFVEETISVGVESLSVILGKGNTVVKDLQARSGARITVECEDESSGPYRSIHIAGNAHQVEHAIALIQAQIESHHDIGRRDAGGNSECNDDRSFEGEVSCRHWQYERTSFRDIRPKRRVAIRRRCRFSRAKYR
jgi:KH domain